MKNLNNKNYCFQICKDCGLFLFFASENLKNDKILLINAVKNNPFAFFCASEHLQRDFMFVKECVKANNKTVGLLGNFFVQNTSDLQAVIKLSPQAYEYLPESFKSNQNIAISAIEKDASLVLSVPKELLTREFCVKVAQINFGAIKYIEQIKSSMNNLS